MLLLILLFSVWIDRVSPSSSLESTSSDESPPDATCLSKNAAGRCIDDALHFNRIDITTDPHKHVAIRLHAYSKETVSMTVMLLFHSPRHTVAAPLANSTVTYAAASAYHNALLLNGQTYASLAAITRQSQFGYANRLPIVGKAHRSRFAYDLVSDASHWNRLTKTSAVTTSSAGVLLDTILPIDYTVLGVAQTTVAPVVYQAVLSLDRQSSLWQRYNVVRFTPYEMSLHYVVGGAIDRAVGRTHAHTTQLRCHTNMRHADDNCRLRPTRPIVVGGRNYDASHYRVIVDMHSAHNYLPVDLFYHWQTLSVYRRNIAVGLGSDNTSNTLILNSRFNFEVNRHGTDIVIGIDLLHIFPIVAYSRETHEIQVWYDATSHTLAGQHQTVAIVLSFFFLLCLYCYFDLMSNDNRRIYHFLMRYSTLTFQWFYFNVRQALIELIMLVTSLVVTILVLVYTDYNASNQAQRVILFSLLILYHFVVLLATVALSPELIRQAVIHHFNFDPVVQQQQQHREAGSGATPTTTHSGTIASTQRVITSFTSPTPHLRSRDYFAKSTSPSMNSTFKAGWSVSPLGDDNGVVVSLDTQQQQQQQDKDFEQVREEHIDADESNLAKRYTTNAMARHTTLLLLILLTLLLILNFSSIDNYVYMLLLFVVSLVFLYLYVYHLFICLIYARERPVDMATPRLPLSFILFLVGESLCLAFYVAWSIACLYTDYARAVNSIYSDTFIVLMMLILVAIIFLLVCHKIYAHMDTVIHTYYASVTPEKKKKPSLTSNGSNNSKKTV